MSKQLFELMREQEIQTSNFLPTKKEVLKSSENFAKKLLESGEVEKLEVLAQATRLKDAVTAVFDAIKANIPHEEQTAYGIQIIPSNGRKMVQYLEDPIWCELQEAVKQREKLLNLAQTQETADLYGNLVPKVSVKYASDSLTIKY